MQNVRKRFASLAATLTILSVTAVGAVAQGDEGDEVSFRVPLPEECVVDPRDQADIDAVLAAGEHQLVLTDGLPVPLGTRADGDTRFAVEETIYELVACLNAGDAARGATLFSDNGLRGFYGVPVDDTSAAEQAPAGTPTARPDEQWLLLRAVTDVSILVDGRVAAFVILDDPLLRGRAQTILFVFVNEGGAWLIDGTVGFSVVAPVATPTP
ncbi:MAG: hypothetical protein M3464_02810 [Chloroflexota bacterium]|nr:hypothetical protein [Chloroflexota bacterium]